MADIIIYTDGGSRGNPGPAALGAYITNSEGIPLAKIAKYIGETTNNTAEYQAIISGLDWAVENKQKENINKITFYMDSQLAYSQLTGLYKVKNESIRSLVFEVKTLENILSVPIFYNHIPREKNKQADALVNIALDNKLNNP